MFKKTIIKKTVVTGEILQIGTGAIQVDMKKENFHRISRIIFKNNEEKLLVENIQSTEGIINTLTPGMLGDFYFIEADAAFSTKTFFLYGIKLENGNFELADSFRSILLKSFFAFKIMLFLLVFVFYMTIGMIISLFIITVFNIAIGNIFIVDLFVTSLLYFPVKYFLNGLKLYEKVMDQIEYEFIGSDKDMIKI